MSPQPTRAAVRRTHEPALKWQIVLRMEAGENVSALAREAQVRRKVLYEWRDAMRQHGADAFPGPGGRPPRPAIPESASGNALALAHERIAALERKVGQQALELDFFSAAWQRLAALPGPAPAPCSARSSANAPTAPPKA